MYNIKLLNNISDIIYSQLTPESFQITDDLDSAHGILVRSANMHDITLPPNLLGVARAGAGYNNIPIDKCTDQGIVVFNTPGANANAVKELVLASLFLTSRKIYEGIEWVKTLKGKGNEISKLIEKGKSDFTGPELAGKKLGVIGLGAIGALVANGAHGIGMDVTGYDPFISVKAAWSLSRSVHQADNLDTILAESDYISIHIPLTSDTKDYLNKESFSKMKKGARLLNFSRGELVNTEDLLAAIEEGIVSTYATDFPNEQLLGSDNVIPIPHLGASTPESEDNCAMMASQQLRTYIETGNIVNSVNFPHCEMPNTGHIRITIAHRNVPNMVSQITTRLATNNINIANMMNKSKGNAAYTIIDIDGIAPTELLQNILDIDGVIKVRKIPQE
ncbi:MAG: 3-phosphoglycerate dehydrogenase [Clostridiales bacterium]|nr:3-phosphoglycerate dehydrogenase [Clostridiales bacterium]